jgi:hypothetical protein
MGPEAGLQGRQGHERRTSHIRRHRHRGNGLAVDASNVYFTGVAYGNDGVFFVPIGGGTVTMLATDYESPTNIALDANAVYWTDSNASFPAIAKVAKP